MYFVEKPKKSIIHRSQPFIIFILVIVIIQLNFFSKQNDLTPVKETVTHQPHPVKKRALHVSGDEELHVVGVYEESLQDEVLGNLVATTADIVVDRPGKKVILLISSFKALKWNVITTKDTHIKDIVLNSHESKRSPILLNGNVFDPAHVNIKSKVYKTEGKHFAKFKEEVRNKIGLTISSFSGSYYAQKEYAVNAISDDKKLQINYLKTDYPDFVSKQTTFETFTNKFKGFKGVFNLEGELIKKLPLSIKRGKAVYVEKEKQYYQLDYNAINQYDDQGNLLNKIILDLDLPAFSGAKSITYDEGNDKIVILTSEVFNYLYLYDLKSKKWSIVSLGKSITYVKEETPFIERQAAWIDIKYDKDHKNYILMTPPIEEFGILIAVVNDKGKFISKDYVARQSFVGLDDVFNPGNVNSSEMEIVKATRDYLIITACETSFNPEIARLYIYNRKDKKAYLAWFLEK